MFLNWELLGILPDELDLPGTGHVDHSVRFNAHSLFDSCVESLVFWESKLLKVS